MVASIPAVPYWQPRLGSLGDVVTALEDIAQCIATILGTVKGQVPHRPDFGLDPMAYVDMPFNRVKPRIVRDILQAIARDEPRATVVKVTVSPDTTGAGWVQVLLVWRPTQGGDLVTSEVTL